jgi:predicted GTPase
MMFAMRQLLLVKSSINFSSEDSNSTSSLSVSKAIVPSRSSEVPPLMHDQSGQTGLGKSTLINTLFASHLIDSQGRKDVDELVPQTATIKDNAHGESPGDRSSQ